MSDWIVYWFVLAFVLNEFMAGTMSNLYFKSVSIINKSFLLRYDTLKPNSALTLMFSFNSIFFKKDLFIDALTEIKLDAISLFIDFINAMLGGKLFLRFEHWLIAIPSLILFFLIVHITAFAHGYYRRWFIRGFIDFVYTPILKFKKIIIWLFFTKEYKYIISPIKLKIWLWLIKLSFSFHTAKIEYKEKASKFYNDYWFLIFYPGKICKGFISLLTRYCLFIFNFISTVLTVISKMLMFIFNSISKILLFLFKI